MMKCRILDFEAVDWNALDRFADRTVFQTREWLRFIAETQKATPVLVELQQDGQLAGYFSGLTVKKFGVKVLGSSFPGWTTPYVGFNMLPGASRSAALAAVETLAWDTLKCIHMEVSDPHFAADDGEKLGFSSGSYTSYRTDLRKSEDELFNGMDSACRRCVRKAEKSGVTIEEAHDLAFADEYYEQLKDVFAKQKLVPTYPVERVRSLVKHLEPTGRVLLLRARDPEGKCIATGISGVTRAFGRDKRGVPTNTFSGMSCATGRTGAWTCMTGAGKVPTKKNTAACRTMCHGLRSRVT
jgi:hypothetical protein